jgi:hypothetical protein
MSRARVLAEKRVPADMPPLLSVHRRLLVDSAACRLGRGSLLHDRNEVCLALRATAAAFEESPLLDQKRHMVDIALNLR